MPNPILITYASLTGVTMEAATTLHGRLTTELPDKQFELLNIRDLTPAKLAEYTQVILGCSTWDHGIPAPDGEAFLSDLVQAKPDLSNTNVGMFGVGDSAYPAFCEALPLIREDLERYNCKVYDAEFTIDGYPNEAIMVQLIDWAKTFIATTKPAS